MSERTRNFQERGTATRHYLRSHGMPGWLIHTAARFAPSGLAERLEEEWHADLAVQTSTTFARFRFAIGCCWATGMIVWEHRPETFAVASVASRPNGTPGYLSDESAIFANRSLTCFLFAGLHVLLFYVVMTGLAVKIMKVVPTAFDAQIVRLPSARAVTTSPSAAQFSVSPLRIPYPALLTFDTLTEPKDAVSNARHKGKHRWQ